jgi:L-fuconolactonase
VGIGDSVTSADAGIPTDTGISTIDAHHHVWDLAVRDQPWLLDEAMTPIRRRFGIDDFAAAVADGIAGSIVVQTVADVGETEELLDLADSVPLVRGVVGYVDVAAPDVGEQLDRLLASRSGAWLVGIRSLVQDEPDDDWLVRPMVLAGLREIARRDLVYDVLIRCDQLDAAVRAARMVDGRFVLDHLAKPDIAFGGWEPWATGLAELGSCENVTAKLSGLVTEANWTTWSVGDLRPYVDHAIETFGPDRLLFGSDWPVCLLAASYDQVVAAAHQLVGRLTLDERTDILGGTATAIYRLEHHSGRSPV